MTEPSRDEVLSQIEAWQFEQRVRKIVRDEIQQQSARDQLQDARRTLQEISHTCLTCGGEGSVPGFWLGTIKTCPACHGSGRQ